MMHLLYDLFFYCANPTAILLILIIICITILCKQQRKHFSIKQNSQNGTFVPIPSPPKMPVIGHMHLLRNHRENPWAGFEEIRQQYGDMVSLKMGVHPMILVSSFSVAREVLLQKGEIFADRPSFSRYNVIFGGDQENSLALCSWSNVHKDRRKLCRKGVVPSNFSPRHKLLESIISKSITRTLDELTRIDRGSSIVDIPSKFTEKATNDEHVHYVATKKDILFITSDIFMRFLCSQSYPHSDKEYDEFNHGCDFVFWDINQSQAIDFLPYLTSFRIGNSYLKGLEKVTDSLRHFIHERIFESRFKKFSEAATSADRGVGDHVDYLDSLILEHISGTTSMTLADYRVGFEDLLAGHAAVANILMRVLGHLALDEKVQNLIHEEVQHIDLDDLNYRAILPITDAALQEALRLASSPIVPHVAREDTSINGYHVPKGTMILFNMYHVNLSESLWEKPYEYNPMRFVQTVDSVTGTKKLNVPKHFIPFSVGKRQCLGFKMVETITIKTVANICKNYVIKANDDELVRQLLIPRGSIALNPSVQCYDLKLFPR